MTEQVLDSLEYEGQNYSIIDTDGDGLYCLNLHQHGLKPVSWCTDCWSGYSCEFIIKAQKLCVHNLKICLTEPSADEQIPVKKVDAPSINGCMPVDLSSNKNSSFEYLYSDINLPIYFTGKLLIGNDFTWISIYDRVELDVHPMYQYRKLYELIFQSGILTERNDISPEVVDRWIKIENCRRTEFREWKDQEVVSFSDLSECL